MPTLVRHRDERFFPAPGVSGVGTFTEAFASWTSGTALNQLNAAIGSLHNSLIQMINLLPGLNIKQAEVEVLAKKPGNFFSGPFGTQIPSAQGIEYMKAAQAVKDGYTRVTVYVFQMDQIADVLNLNQGKISTAYSGVSGFLNSYYRWKEVLGTKLWNRPGTGELFQKMQGAKWGAWLELGGSSKGYDYNDPRYLQAANIAATKVTGINAGPTSPSGLSGLGALGLEPISTTVAVILLIKTIVVVVGIVAIVVGIVALAKEFNAKAIKIADMRTEYEKRTEVQRKEYFERRAKEGAGTQTIQSEWDQIRSGSEARQKGAEKTVQDTKGLPESAGDFMGKLVLPLVLVGGAVVIIPMFMKK